MKEQATGRPPSQPRREREPSGGFLWELLRTGLIVLIIVLPIRFFVAQPFIVSGASMQPTYATGDYLIIDQLSYSFNDPDRQDVVVFRYPDNPSKFFIKRVIGLPGETVELGPEQTTIINEANPDGFVLAEPYLQSDDFQQQEKRVTLKSDEYFVMGDNRSSSSDSRNWGPLPAENIIGRSYLRLLPPAKASIMPGYSTDDSGEDVAREAP